ncbi:MAG: beta-N-acetylhexosaminidase [Ignavibacteria bacterium]|nr:beta-N-acetylhexosaminidase [Ignavibacteria bacterium]
MKSSFCRKALLVFLLFVLPSIVNSQIFPKPYLTTYPGVIPEPKQNYEKKDERINVDASFVISVEGAASEKLMNAVNRFYIRLSNSVKSRFELPKVVNGKTENAKLIIKAEKEEDIKLGTDESYNLKFSSTKIYLQSKTDIGAIRGLQTLIQLFDEEDNTYFFKGGEYPDNPAFPWRGLLIDVCRHFSPMDVLKRNIDGMEAAKLNVFHWHLSEDQGFRVECKTFPKLHGMGSNGDYYTQEQIKDIIKYANDRGIRVVPEFDIPGHSTAWFAGYPEYASAPGPYEIEKYFGVFDPSFNPAKEETYEFFDKFFAEMSGLFNDEYIHIGGDENEGKQWDANPEIQEFKLKNNLKTNHELQAYFNKRIQKILEKYGKKMIGWDEIFSESLPKDIVIHSWRGKDAMINAAKLGYSSILSNGYYIDLCQSIFDHYTNTPLTGTESLSPEERKHILGGEATMWAELVTEQNIDSRIWPRTAAIAEILWSGNSFIDNAASLSGDTVEMKMGIYKRFEKFSNYLDEIGLKHKANKEVMIKAISNEQTINAIKDLIAFVQPLKYYKRHKYTKYTQFTPLNRIVDISTPDAPMAIEFNFLADKILKGNAVPDDIDNALKYFHGIESDILQYKDGMLLPSNDNFYKDKTELFIKRFEYFNNSVLLLLTFIKDKKTLSSEKIDAINKGIYFESLKEPFEETDFPAYDGFIKLYQFVKEEKHLK